MNCWLCDCNAWRPFTTVNSYNLIRCSNCNVTIVQNPPDRNTLNDIYSALYFANGKYQADTAVTKEYSRRLRLIKKISSAKLFDYGCATGDFMNYASQHGYSVWGTDISEDALAIAKQKYPHLKDRFISMADLESFVNGNLKMDIITAWDVVEHLQNPMLDILTISRALRPGGVLGISTPNIGAFVAVLMKRRWAFMTPPEHLTFFNKSSLTRMLEVLQLKTLRWFSRGKWANIGFITYKLGRVFPSLKNGKVYEAIRKSRIAGLCIYVPTGDVQYILAIKSVER